jgi:hypothetical protein
LLWATVLARKRAESVPPEERSGASEAEAPAKKLGQSASPQPDWAAVSRPEPEYALEPERQRERTALPTGTWAVAPTRWVQKPSAEASEANRELTERNAKESLAPIRAGEAAAQSRRLAGVRI